MKNSKNDNSSSFQNKLLLSLKDQNLNEFKQIIESNSNSKLFDANYFYDESDDNRGTLLDIACRSSGNSEFVQILLSNFANVNAINSITGKAAIHEAVEKSDTDTLDILIKKYWYSECDIDLPDRNGNTALHIAIQLNKIDFMNTLLRNPSRIDINVGTSQNATPFHLALHQGNLEAASLLLKCSDIDLDFQKDSQGRTCREIIKQQYSEELGQQLQAIQSTSDTSSILFSLLKRGETKLFNRLAGELQVQFLEQNHNGCQAYLQCACNLGLVNIVETLLSKGVNPNNMMERRSLTPAMIAARNGFADVLELLITNPNIELQIEELGSVLHSVMEGMFNKATDQRSGHYKCLELILNKAKSRDGLDLNFEDHAGYTSLFMATILSDDRVIKSLIYAGARFYQKNHTGETYLMINSSMLGEYLDSCISFKNESPFIIDRDIIIDYKTLVNPSINLHDGDINVAELNDRVNIEMETSPILEEAVKKNIVCRDLNEMEIFTILEEATELKELLKHPVLKSFIHMKWHLVKKYYFINFAIYLLFCLSLSSYILFIYSDSSPSSSSLSNQTAME